MFLANPMRKQIICKGKAMKHMKTGATPSVRTVFMWSKMDEKQSVHLKIVGYIKEK